MNPQDPDQQSGVPFKIFKVLLGGCCAMLCPVVPWSLGRHPMDPAGLMKQQVEQGLVPKPGDGSGTSDGSGPPKLHPLPPWAWVNHGEPVCPGGERRNY